MNVNPPKDLLRKSQKNYGDRFMPPHPAPSPARGEGFKNELGIKK